MTKKEWKKAKHMASEYLEMGNIESTKEKKDEIQLPKMRIPMKLPHEH